MKFTAPAPSSAKYTLAPPIFYNEDAVGVMDGQTILGAISRREFNSYRLEYRTSFKHPIIGLLLSIVCIGASIKVAISEAITVVSQTVILNSGFIAVCGFVFSCGAILIVGVLRRRPIPWIVLMAGSIEKAFPLKSELPPEVVEILNTLCIEPPASPTRQTCPACGHALRGSKGVCPRCGQLV